MANKKCKLGLIGLGSQMRENIFPALRMMKRVKIVAVCDQVVAKAEQVSHDFEIENYYSNYKEMLANTVLDAVVCASFPQVHVEVAHECIESRLPVFVEKPPSNTTEELLNLVQFAEKNKCISGVGMNYRFASPVKRVAEILKESAFGNLRHLSIKHYCNKPKQPFWNLDSLVRSFLLSQVIHSLDLFMYFGEGIKNVSVEGFRQKDLLFFNIKVACNNEITGNLTTGNCSPHFILDMEFITDRSKIINLDSLWSIKINDVEKSYVSNECSKWSDYWAPSPLNSGYSRSGYFDELEEFVSSVIEEKPFTPSLTDLVPLYHVLDDIERQFAAILRE